VKTPPFFWRGPRRAACARWGAFWYYQPVIREHVVEAFAHAALSPDPDLAIAALMIARVEYPRLDAGPYLDQLDEIGREAKLRVDAAARVRGDVPAHVDPDRYAQVLALNDYVFGELRFVGNDVRYEDPRNSFLNEVLDRRTGIPISLALVYMEIARRADVHVVGINFPGHFLMRCPSRHGLAYSEDLIIDAFHGGALLSEDACRTLLRRHAGDEAVFDAQLLARATKPQILVRMLVNLKRLYVSMHSFPQARDVTELLLAVNPSAANELRDRGLLAYNLNHYAAALRDLQTYLQLSNKTELNDDLRDEHAQVWEHIKALRRRVASLN
jgi:regulator of sirC expression with transglutaminase-like and TPR domain